MNIYQKISSNDWHIDPPKGCGKGGGGREGERERDTGSNSRTEVQKTPRGRRQEKGDRQRG